MDASRRVSGQLSRRKPAPTIYGPGDTRPGFVGVVVRSAPPSNVGKSAAPCRAIPGMTVANGIDNAAAIDRPAAHLPDGPAHVARAHPRVLPSFHEGTVP